MGKQLVTVVAGLLCEIRTCPAERTWGPTPPVDGHWHGTVELLRTAVVDGWSFSLSGRMLSYCPEHADLVWQCRCRKGRPERCALHDSYIASQVWDSTLTPIDLALLVRKSS